MAMPYETYYQDDFLQSKQWRPLSCGVAFFMSNLYQKSKLYQRVYDSYTDFLWTLIEKFDAYVEHKFPDIIRKLIKWENVEPYMVEMYKSGDLTLMEILRMQINDATI